MLLGLIKRNGLMDDMKRNRLGDFFEKQIKKTDG